MKRIALLLAAILLSAPAQAAYITNVAAVLHFAIQDATDGSLVTSGTPVIVITKDGGTQAAATNAAVHEGNGQWSLQLTATEMNATTVGVLITESGSAPVSMQLSTISPTTFADAVYNRTSPEPTSPPAANASLGEKIAWLFLDKRNRKRVTPSLIQWYADDATTIIGDSDVSPNNSTEVITSEAAVP